MGIIPREILQFCQIFGAFPLKYTEGANTEPRLLFSFKLYYWSLILYTILTSTSMISIIYMIYTNVLAGNRVSAATLLVESFSLSLLTIAVASSQSRKYEIFSEMCQVVERVDKRLKLKIKDSSTGRKVYFTLLYTTTVLVLTYVVRSNRKPDYWLYFLYYITYYTQASLFLQFTFICNSFARRFTIINEKIRVEATKQNQQQHRTSDSSAEPLDQLGALMNCISLLYDALEKANSFYGQQLLPALFSALVHGISSIYSLLTTNPTEDIPYFAIQAVWVFTHIVYLLLLVLPATAVLQGTEETATIVCGLIRWSLHNSEIRKKLKVFLLQLSHYKKGLSVLGLFQLDNEVLTCITSSVTTYLVILHQVQRVSDPVIASDFPINFTLASSCMSNTTTQLRP